MPHRLVIILLLSGIVSSVIAAEPRQFAEPLNVAAEKTKIVNEFIEAQQKKLPPAEAVAARDEAFSQLAAAAEQANSTEYAPLSQIYSALGRHEDVIRVTRIALEKYPDDFGYRVALVKSLSVLKRTDEAGTEYDKTVALDISPTNTSSYLYSFTDAAKTYISLLNANGKGAEARQALDAWVAQLDKLEAQSDKIPGYQAGPFGTMSSVRSAIQPFDNLLPKQSASTRPAQNPVPMNTVPVNPVPVNTITKLDVAAEKSKIMNEFAAAVRTLGYDKASAARVQALSQLAAKAEKEKSDQYGDILDIYATLNRHEDVVRIAPAAMEANPTEYWFWASYIKSLGNLQLWDKAQAECERMISAEVAPQVASAYLQGVFNGVKAHARLLAGKNKNSQADQLLAAWNTQLNKLEAELEKTPGYNPGPQSPIWIARQDVIAFQSELRRPFSIESPLRTQYFEILSRFKLGPRQRGQQMSPEELKILAAREEALRQLGSGKDAANSKDFWALMSIYCNARQPDEAFAAFDKWVHLDIPLADVEPWLQPATYSNPPRVNELVWLLCDTGKFANAWQVVSSLDSKVEQLLALYDKGPVPPGLNRTTLTNVKSQLGAISSNIEQAEIKFYASATGPIEYYFRQPLNLAKGRDRINTWFTERRSGRTSGPEFNEVRLREIDALEQLIAAAEAANSTDHLNLALIYLDLERPDDAEREARAGLKLDRADISVQSILIDVLCRAKRFEEAFVEFRNLLAIKPPAAEAASYEFGVSYRGGMLVGHFAHVGKFAQARQVCDVWQDWIDDQAQLQKKNAKGEAELPQWLAHSQEALADARNTIRRQELVGKPFPFPTDVVWLSGTPLKPEDLRDKVVLVEIAWIGNKESLQLLSRIQSWHDKYADEGLQLIGLFWCADSEWNPKWQGSNYVPDLPEKREHESILAAANYYGFKCPLAVAPDIKPLAENYACKGVPQFILVDREGVIRKTFTGWREEAIQALESDIQKALGLE